MSHQYRLTLPLFIERSNKVHNNKYDYSKSKYVNQRTKTVITCPIHGDFLQTPKNHMNGQGCPICGIEKIRSQSKHNYQTFINSSIERFGERYEFPNIENEYENSHSKITIRCTRCGNIFTKIACDHITSPNGGCQHCYFSRSKPEEEIGDFIRSILPNEEIRFNVRDVINGYELDIFVPLHNIAIEFNGLYWHSTRVKDKYYHVKKLKACNDNGIRLVQIFEDEYLYKKDIVLSKIKRLLGKDDALPKIYARKCIVQKIDYSTATDFLDKFHIQGSCKATVYYGAYDTNQNLDGVMTFIRSSGDKWELTRYASRSDALCIGLAGKLFKHFVNEYNPKYVKSFADRRWTISADDNLYTKIGFHLSEVERPDYAYVINGTVKRFHKFSFRKKYLIKKYNLSPDLTESEMAEKINAYKIYNCGLLKYVWGPDVSTIQPKNS